MAMKRTTQIALLGALLFLAGCAKRNHSVAIPDATKAWSHEFSGPSGIFIEGGLFVRITGNLRGVGNVTIDGYEHALRGEGNIERIHHASENWNDTCSIAFAPVSVQEGNLTVEVVFGGWPLWHRYPSKNSEPLRTGSNVSWTTWHDGGTQKYSVGCYDDGEKNGTWRYWDESGKLVRTEEWKDGKLIQNDSANQPMHPDARNSRR